jgi:hypothetical protein
MVIGVFPTPYCVRSSVFRRAKTAPTGFADGYDRDDGTVLSEGTSRPAAIGLERTLRLYFLQQWYGLAHEALEDSLYDSAALRAFAGIALAVEAVPDATTLMKFRHRLEKHELTRKLFDEIGIMLCERGLLLKEGTMLTQRAVCK